MSEEKMAIYEVVEPATEPQGLAKLLGDIKSEIEKYVVINESQAAALAVWVIHTYVYRAREAVAYVAIQSPEKRCGKTTLLSVLAGLASKSLVASNISVGALFRAIDEAGPTLFIDEADTFLGANTVMRGVLNCGNTRRTAYVLRVAEGRGGARGEGVSKVARYTCWCPKVVAMIGRVPETLADRSIVINMVRKLVAEKRESLAEFKPGQLQARCERWAKDHLADVANYARQDGAMANDRASDTYEPLLVIAALAGSGWSGKLRAAAKELCAHENTEPEAASLLLDIMAVFIVKGVKRIFSRDLAEELKGKSGWVVYDVTTRHAVNELRVAQVLRRYSIRPKPVRVGPVVGRGYKWEQFTEALERYVPKAEVAGKVDELRRGADLQREGKPSKAEAGQAEGGVAGCAGGIGVACSLQGGA